MRALRRRNLLFLLLFATANPAFAKSPSTDTPKPAPGFSLPGRTGTVSLDSLRGRAVLVDFWASWCDPCRRSFPWLRSLHEQYAGKGLTIVAINLDKDHDAALAFLQKYPAPFLVAFDPAGKTAEAFHVAAMPSSYLVGPTGNILAAHIGFDPKRTDSLEKLIKEACSK
jgi:thiol-disulfide isomerase/thioredoxin